MFPIIANEGVEGLKGKACDVSRGQAPSDNEQEPYSERR